MTSILKRLYLNNRINKISFHFLKHKKTIPYFTLTLSLLSLSFFGIFAIRPTLKTAITLVKSVSDLKKINIEYENKIGNVIRAQSEYEKIRGDLPLVNIALPKEASFNKLALALEKFATNSGITINQLQIDRVPISNQNSDNKLNKYGFNLIFSGDYFSMSSYLQHLTNWQRIVSIDSIEISQEGSTISGNLKINLKGSAYYEP